MTTWSRRSASSAGVAALAILAACSGGGGDGASCDDVERLLDSRAPTHVIDVEAADYDFHPPTSGPHFGGRPPRPGVYDDPVPEAKQVLALEVGMVVLQYDDVAAEDADRLEEVAGERDDVIVTPAAKPIDGGRQVAFTAWGLRQRCDGVSEEVVDAAQAFVDDYAGRSAEESNR